MYAYIKMNRGVTLIELVVVFGAIAILATITFSALAPLRDATTLNSVAEQGISLLNEARSKTLSSLAGSQYGVHFETTKMVLFRGTAYNSFDPENSVVTIPVAVTISSVALNGGGVDVLFKRLTGSTDTHGSITFRLTNNPAKTRIINITAAGAFNF